MTDRNTSQARAAQDAVVLLTGASGALGSHILVQLAMSKTVKRIICLNRASTSSNDPYARQYSRSKEKGADIPELVRYKIEVVETDTALPQLGLTDRVHEDLAAIVTHIVHDAWPVDFRRPLLSFRPQVKTLVNLVGLCTRAHSSRRGSDGGGFKVRLLFVSSIAVVGSEQHGRERRIPLVVPETPVPRDGRALPLAYAEAKRGCEIMIQLATESGKVDGFVVRMGQIAGAVSNGYWHASEHIPTMFRASMEVGALPKLAGKISWIPLECAAQAVTDILLCGDADLRPIYHVENPQRQSWDSILLPMSSYFSIPLVSYQEWIERFKRHVKMIEMARWSAEKGSHYRSDPRLLLLLDLSEWIRCMASGSVVLGMENALQTSSTLDKTETIGPQLLAKYIRYWCDQGLLPSSVAHP